MQEFTVPLSDGRKFKVMANTQAEANGVVEAHLDKEFGIGAAGTAEDVVKQTGVGLGKGLIGLKGMGGDIKNLIKDLAIQAGGDKDKIEANFEKLDPLFSVMGMGNSSGEIQKAVESVTGEFRTAKTTAGEIAETVGEFLPGAALPGSRLVKAAQVVLPTIGAEGSERAVKALGFGATGQQVARTIGGVIGGGLVGGSRRVITPNPVTNPTITRSVEALADEGITSLTAGQRTGNAKLLKREAMSPDSHAGRTIDAQRGEFTQSVLERVGVNSNRASPDVIDDAFTATENQFTALQGRNTMTVTPQLRNDVRNVVDSFVDEIPEAAVPPVVRNLPDRLDRSPFLSGTEYKELRSSITRVARGATTPEVSRPMNEIARALDDVMENTIRQHNPNDLGAFQDVRRNWRNLIVLEKAAKGPGKMSASGILTPARVRAAAVQVEGGQNFVRGRGEFTPLSQAGVERLELPSSSGSPEGMIATGNVSMRSLLGSIPRALSTSRPGQAFLGNQSFHPRSLGGVGGFSRGALAGIQSQRR